MAQTLAEIGKLLNNDLISPVIDQVVKVNPIFEFMPAYGYQGKAAVISSRPDQTANFLAEGAAVPASLATVISQKTVTATTIIRDADVSNLSLASSTGAMEDAAQVEISSAATGVGRSLQDGIINGTGLAGSMNSLFSEATNTIAPVDVVLGDALTFDKLDQLVDNVKSKNGKVDFIVMSFSMRRKYRQLQRSLGGNSLEQIALTESITLDQYEGINIFVSDYKFATETIDGLAITGGTWDSLYAGVFDSGNLTDGCSLVYPSSSSAGMNIESLGNLEGLDAKRFRVKWYGNFVAASSNAVSRAYGIDPAL